MPCSHVTQISALSIHRRDCLGLVLFLNSLKTNKTLCIIFIVTYLQNLCVYWAQLKIVHGGVRESTSFSNVSYTKIGNSGSIHNFPKDGMLFSSAPAVDLPILFRNGVHLIFSFIFVNILCNHKEQHAEPTLACLTARRSAV